MNRQLLLKDLLVLDGDLPFAADMRVCGSRVTDLEAGLTPNRFEQVIDCSGHLVIPAFINSHDHLHFNLYHRIGHPPYNNAEEWGIDLHNNWSQTIDLIERVPRRLRYLWGAWKNLFTGATRVAHHDPYSHHLSLLYPVDVCRRYTFAHSVYDEQELTKALAARKPETPFIIHVAEGRDEKSASEVGILGKLGGLDSRTIAVHAINVSRQDIALLKEAGSSVVWCPTSNMYLFDKTAPIDRLREKVRVALGTDSTLTGATTLFEEMRFAHERFGVAARDLFRMVTSNAREILRLSDDAGTLMPGGRADFFLLPTDSSDPYERILHAEPGDISLMVNCGRPLFFDEDMFTHFDHSQHSCSLHLNGKKKVFTDYRISRLIEKLNPFLGHYSYLFQE